MKNPFDDLRRKQDLERQKRKDKKQQYWQYIETKHKNRTQLWKQYDSMVTDILRQLQVALLPNHRVDSKPPDSLRKFRQFWEQLLRSKDSALRDGAFYVSPQLESWLVLHKNRKRDDDQEIIRRSFALWVQLKIDENDQPFQFMCGYVGMNGDEKVEKMAECGLSRNELTLCLKDLMQSVRFV